MVVRGHILFIGYWILKVNSCIIIKNKTKKGYKEKSEHFDAAFCKIKPNKIGPKWFTVMKNIAPVDGNSAAWTTVKTSSHLFIHEK